MRKGKKKRVLKWAASNVKKTLKEDLSLVYVPIGSHFYAEETTNVLLNETIRLMEERGYEYKGSIGLSIGMRKAEFHKKAN